MANELQKYKQFIEDNIVEQDIGYRGGNLKVNAAGLFPKLEGEAIVGAYQNYLGGGMAGKIVGAAMFDPAVLGKRDRAKFEELLKACVAYFHWVNNGGGDEYMQENYGELEQNQQLPVSGY